jgi:hypothetical protein
MSDCLLVLHWPDFREQRRAERQYSAPLLACAIHRRMARRGTRCLGYGTGASELSSAAAAGFMRWGLRPLEGEPTAAVLAELLSAHPGAGEVVLAMDPSRAADALPQLSPGTARVEIWGPANLPDEGFEFRGGVVRLSASVALQLSTARSVALFADWRLVEPTLRAMSLPSDLETARGALLRHAEMLGLPADARLYGPWGQPVSLVGEAGEADSETEADVGDRPLWADVMALLRDGQALPDSVLLVAEGSGLDDAARCAREQGVRIVLCHPEPHRISRELQAQVEAVVPLEALFAYDERLSRKRAAPAHAEISPRPPLEPSGATPGEAELDPLPPASTISASARLGPWVRLMYHIECVLRQHRWSRAPFRKLAAELAELEEFGPTPTNAMMWLNRARGEATLVCEQESHRSDPGLRVSMCRPNPEHPVARAAVEVPDRCLRLLYQMLQKMPWVSFKLLRGVLLRDQWLGGPPYYLEETSVDEWLNFLVRDGAITMTKEPNLANPEYPVTALRLNEEHPLSRAVVSEAIQGTRLAAERAILAVDHFLTRQRKPWMAMSALRRALDGMSREELQEVLQGLQSLGALVTESYPNPQKEHFTTGCRLKSDEPLVAEVLDTRNTIVRVTQFQHRSQSWVPLAKIDEELATRRAGIETTGHRLAWFLLLRDEGILELDHEGPLSDATWTKVRCRLNVTDAVVRSIVAETHEAHSEVGV